MVCNVAELLGVAWGSRLQVVGREGGRKELGRLVPLDEAVLQAGLGEAAVETRACSRHHPAPRTPTALCVRQPPCAGTPA